MSRAGRPVLFAHRGAAAEYPENTMPAFRRALEVGAMALETDAHLTRDGVVVLSHDPSGGRMTGVRAAIREVAYAELASWDAGWGFVRPDGSRPFAGQGFRMPTLEEALVALPEVPFNVDMKQEQPSMVEAVLELTRRLGAQRRVRLASFHSATLRKARRLGYEGETSFGRREAARLVLAPSFALAAIGSEGQAAQVPLVVAGVRLDTPWFIARCHSRGIAVHYWTINDPQEAARLLALGADGIMTDDPAAIAPVFAAL